MQQASLIGCILTTGISLSLASNNLGSINSLQIGMREEEMVYQNKDPMEIEEPSPPHSGEGQEAQGNVHP
jgi:hypothetical protein